LLHYYRAFARRNLAVDILPAKKLTDWSQLKGYKLVIAPAINIMTETLAKVLEDFVKHGNHLVLTLRTGWKDEYNALLPMRPPGFLAKIAGVDVEEYFALDQPVAIKGNFFEGEARIWAERLKLTGQYALGMGKYKESNGWLDGKPAASVTGVSGGSGLVYYVGAYLDEDAQQVMVDRLITNAHLRAITTPENVEVHTRTREDGTEVYFVINHSRQEATMWLPWIALEHLEDRLIEDELKLGPYGVAIVTKEEEEE
jgi:beta-galactosidase